MRTEEPMQATRARRQNTAGRSHVVASTPCEECGCHYDHSLDEPGIVLEAAEAIEEGCLDGLCDCHVFPAVGIRFKLNFAS